MWCNIFLKQFYTAIYAPASLTPAAFSLCSARRLGPMQPTFQRKPTDDEMQTDRYGVGADTTLFLDKMPPDYTESDLRALIVEKGGGADSLVNIWFGTKPLGPGEFRTATARFKHTQDAVNCRQLLQHYKEEHWQLGMRVNFVRRKGEGRPGGGEAEGGTRDMEATRHGGSRRVSARPSTIQR